MIKEIPGVSTAIQTLSGEYVASTTSPNSRTSYQKYLDGDGPIPNRAQLNARPSLVRRVAAGIGNTLSHVTETLLNRKVAHGLGVVACAALVPLMASTTAAASVESTPEHSATSASADINFDNTVIFYNGANDGATGSPALTKTPTPSSEFAIFHSGNETGQKILGRWHPGTVFKAPFTAPAIGPNSYDDTTAFVKKDVEQLSDSAPEASEQDFAAWSVATQGTLEGVATSAAKHPNITYNVHLIGTPLKKDGLGDELQGPLAPLGQAAGMMGIHVDSSEAVEQLPANVHATIDGSDVYTDGVISNDGKFRPIETIDKIAAHYNLLGATEYIDGRVVSEETHIGTNGATITTRALEIQPVTQRALDKAVDDANSQIQAVVLGVTLPKVTLPDIAIQVAQPTPEIQPMTVTSSPAAEVPLVPVYNASKPTYDPKVVISQPNDIMSGVEQTVTGLPPEFQTPAQGVVNFVSSVLGATPQTQ